jgi:hypothetical protein
MTIIVRPMRELALHDIEKLTTRYKAAFDEYQVIVDKNAELSLLGEKPSQQALLDEERAFEKLDFARHELLEAAARACPTIH